MSEVIWDELENLQKMQHFIIIVMTFLVLDFTFTPSKTIELRLGDGEPK